MDQFPPDIVAIATRRDDPETFVGKVHKIRTGPMLTTGADVMLLPADSPPKYPYEISNVRSERTSCCTAFATRPSSEGAICDLLP
jgi:hypothetical protein